MKAMKLANRGCAAVGLAALAMLPVASNAAPAPDPSTSLAAADSLLKVCTAMANSHVDVIRQQLSQLEQGRSPEDLAKLRSSDAYQSAFQSVTDSLAKVDEPELKKACAGTGAETQ